MEPRVHTVQRPAPEEHGLHTWSGFYGSAFIYPAGVHGTRPPASRPTGRLDKNIAPVARRLVGATDRWLEAVSRDADPGQHRQRQVLRRFARLQRPLCEHTADVRVGSLPIYHRLTSRGRSPALGWLTYYLHSTSRRSWVSGARAVSFSGLPFRAGPQPLAPGWMVWSSTSPRSREISGSEHRTRHAPAGRGLRASCASSGPTNAPADRSPASLGGATTPLSQGAEGRPPPRPVNS